MASERQIAANRYNARNSTGPRSTTGKKRAARNSLRHGLTINTALSQDCEAVEPLARQIVGNTADEFVLERARAAARAQLDLARVREIKVALINQVSAFGDLGLRPRFRTLREVRIFLGLTVRSKTPDPLPEMPSKEPERTAEAVRRLLPELGKLRRYERRAFTARDRALRELSFAKRSQYLDLKQ
jgi:hypothetical protein